MSEKKKTIRLNKVAKELNVGVATLVEFLNKKGENVENNPNAKIDDKLYDMLATAFQSERKVKEDASKVTISIGKNANKVVKVEDTISDNKPLDKPARDSDELDHVEDEEIRILSTTIEPPAKPVKKKSPKKEEKKPTPEKEEKPKEIEKKEEPKQEPKPEEPKPEPKQEKPKAEKAEKAEPKPEPKAKPKEEPKQEAEAKPTEKQDKKTVAEKTEVPGLKVVGMVDLESLTETRPSRKSKAEKEKKKASKPEKKAPAKETKAKSQKPKETKAKDQKPKVKKAEPKDTKAQDTKAKKPVEKKDNFIKTEYVTLTGPTKTGEVIDLTQFERPKRSPVASSGSKPEGAKSRDKRRRRRIRPSAAQSDKTKTTKEGQTTRSGQTRRPDRKHTPSRRRDPVKKEITSEEIEKQIKETLARLSSTGRSRSSRYRREKRQNIHQQAQIEQEQTAEEQRILKVTEFVTANELATMMDVPVNKIIASCMTLGMFVSINQRLDAEAIQLITEEFGFNTEFVSADVVEALEEFEEEDNIEDLEPRAPIVTVMGHVDHGKTSLLDYIRNANVTEGEAGGITQHIGAYEVKTERGKITFLDTPGHEAFTAMRARGAKITDVSIIVIACDDKVMPQTVEAINHAQAAGVPIVFALNKIDRPGADPERIKSELANMNILVEDWGGKYQSQEISAKHGTNIDQLLEKVLLESEMLELKGNPNKRGKGTIIESSLDRGRGYVAKILVQDGTVRQGDVVLAGTTYGRVRAMYNERNKVVEEVGPSSPLLLLGLNGAPQAGDLFNVVVNEKEAKDIATRRTQLQREQDLRTQKHITLDEIGRRIAIGDFQQLNLIVKGDVDGTVEALSDSLLKLSTPEVQVNVIHKSVGQITESDVLLATASDAIIIGFQVRPSVNARRLADAEQIDIRLYSIIYSAINELKDAIEGMLSPEIQEKIVCNLEIREIFKISKVGTIAGCMCLDGKINRNTNVRVIRDGIVVYTGKLESLKRFKDEVREVVAGQDCGLNIENFNDIKVGDIIEGYEEIEIKRKLK